MKEDEVQRLNPEHIQGQGNGEKWLQSKEALARGHTGPGSQAMRGHPGGRKGPTSNQRQLTAQEARV